MISEGSYDTEAWSNDAGNSVLPYCVFDQINAALMSMRDFYNKYQNLADPNIF